VVLKVLDALLPTHTVAAAPSKEEHLAIAKYLVYGSQGSTTRRPLFLPPYSTALVSRLTALFTGHKKYSPSA
jgi:hypothetical protein